MDRVVFFIDGFNLYHSIIDYNSKKSTLFDYRWINLRKLSECFIGKNTKLEKIYYFTALASWNPQKVKRHQLYIKALLYNNISIIYGKFRKKTRKCRICHGIYKCHEEKQTDVNIAIKLLSSAFENKFDTAYIISGDSDLIPSINEVQQIFPNKKICVIIPIGRSAYELVQVSDRHMKMKEKHLNSSLFPLEIKLESGESINCPKEWANHSKK